MKIPMWSHIKRSMLSRLKVRNTCCSWFYHASHSTCDKEVASLTWSSQQMTLPFQVVNTTWLSQKVASTKQARKSRRESGPPKRLLTNIGPKLKRSICSKWNFHGFMADIQPSSESVHGYVSKSGDLTCLKRQELASQYPHDCFLEVKSCDALMGPRDLHAYSEWFYLTGKLWIFLFLYGDTPRIFFVS